MSVESCLSRSPRASSGRSTSTSPGTLKMQKTTGDAPEDKSGKRSREVKLVNSHEQVAAIAGGRTAKYDSLEPTDSETAQLKGGTARKRQRCVI